MSAEIVDLAARRPGDPNVVVVPHPALVVPHPAAGARQAALDFWNGYGAQNGITTPGWAEMMTDNMLEFLWNEGFKIIRLDAADHEYEGPDWSGEEKPA